MMASLMDLFTQKIEPGALFKDYQVDPRLAEQAAMAAMFAAPAGIISPSSAMRALAGTKILDAQGLPQMVYRGAPSQYTPLTNNQSAASKSADTGMWFSGSAPVASTYSGQMGHVSPAYLNMRNPLVLDAQGGMWHDIPTRQLEDLMNVRVPKATVTSDFMARLAKERGYDGVHFKNMIDPKMNVFDDARVFQPADVFVNFNPDNVYSALSDERLLKMIGY
jgi:hypothetical protein